MLAGVATMTAEAADDLDDEAEAFVRDICVDDSDGRGESALDSFSPKVAMTCRPLAEMRFCLRRAFPRPLARSAWGVMGGQSLLLVEKTRLHHASSSSPSSSRKWSSSSVRRPCYLGGTTIVVEYVNLQMRRLVCKNKKMLSRKVILRIAGIGINIGLLRLLQ